jgi:hemerythrin
VFIHWDRSLLVDYPLIVDEHRMLLWLCRKLQAAIANDMTPTAIKSACVELEAYTKFHLASEENLMHEVGYPDVFEHMRVHAQLLAALRRMTEDIAHGRFSEITIAEFLNRWLVYHIEHHDKKVGKYLISSKNRPIAEKYYSQFLKEAPNET